MCPRTVEEWREAVVERRIEMVRGAPHDPLLDPIVKRLAALPDVADWMVLPLLHAAVDEWESVVLEFAWSTSESPPGTRRVKRQDGSTTN